MTARELKALSIAIAAGVRDGLQPFVTELQALRQVIEYVPEEPTAPPPCLHPKDARVNFGGMGTAEEWLCDARKGGCGYYHKGDGLALTAEQLTTRQ